MTTTKKSTLGRSIATTQTLFVLIYLMILLFSYYEMDVTTLLLWQLGQPIAAMFAGALFIRRKRIGDPPEIKILFAYVLWIAISIIFSTLAINGTILYPYNQATYGTIFAVLVCYPLPFLYADKAQRKAMLSLILRVFVGFYALCCLLAIILVLLQTNIQPAHTYMMGINPAIESRLCMFMHPNSVGAIGNITMMLAIYLALSARRTPEKVTFAIAALLIYTTIGLADSRTNMLAVSLGLGLLAYLALSRRLRGAKPAVAILAGAGAGLVAIAAGYFGFSAVNTLLKWGMVRIASAEEAAALMATQSRNLLDDLSTFTGRNLIWKDALEAMARRPESFLFGVTQDRIMDYMSHLPYVAGNLHNSFLQVLMATGIPGLALILGFLFFVAREAFPLFFSRREGPTLAEQFLPVILLCILVTSMFEAIIFLSSYGVVNVLFFLVAGMTVSAGRAYRKAA